MLANLFATIPPLAWAWLLAARGRFWSSEPTLQARERPRMRSHLQPAVTAVVPARNEAEHIAQSLTSLLAQEYDGPLHVILVNDNSTDRTGDIGLKLALEDERLTVLNGAALPRGWSGKLWAVAQGLHHPQAAGADYVLLTDADIVHGPHHVAQLVLQATASEEAPLDLVSEMVTLRCESFAERALIPAFVFFFQMLYPFRWVNDPEKSVAAAAGGTMLVSRAALDRIGNVDRIHDCLIDDVALATEIKRGGHRIWLGHATEAHSLRSYPRTADVYDMVARTAYVQLDHSPLLLTGTVAGMGVLYLSPVALGLLCRGRSRKLGLLTWGMMALAFQPTLKRYRRSPLWGLALPAIALVYTAATVGSAVRHYKGEGGLWKGRAYS